MNKILIIRTDRIGDVVLTTPIIKILRDQFPKAHLAFLTGPKTKDIVKGNPFLDEIIIYDKHNKHRSIMETIKFSLELKQRKFDAVIVFNPSRRNHLFTFFARIPKRIGYNRKYGFLLTDSFPDKKCEGLKSESFYNEMLLNPIGIQPKCSKELYVPLDSSQDDRIEALLKDSGITYPFVTINVSASCPSKQWPIQNFAHLCQLIYDKLNFSSVLIGNPSLCQETVGLVRCPIVSVDEKLSLPQLTTLIKKSKVHISGDTGPMHIASAVGTPVITIFGRTLSGLGPTRWRPLMGEVHLFHKDIGCNPCLAHRCGLDFDCLKATKVEEVFHAVKSIA